MQSGTVPKRPNVLKPYYMDTSFDVLKDKYPNATLSFSVDKFDSFLQHMRKLIREEFDLQYRAMLNSREETYYSFKHVAAMLDVSTRTLNRWQAIGYLVPVMIGGQRRYRRSDIEKITAERSRSSEPKLVL